MPSTVVLKANGLNVSPNDLTVGEGSLREASNIIIRRDDIIEPRRGFKLFAESFGTGTDRLKQLMVYRDRILRHYQTTLQFENGTNNDGSVNFDNFNGSYSETETGLRIKSIESNGNLYFTTSEGIKKISAASGSELSTSSGYITQAGGIKALDLTTRLSTTLGSSTGFLPSDSAVAYKVVWGTRDANNNLILGTPSQRSEIYNSLQTLMLRDFSRLLGALDDVSRNVTAGGFESLINDANYVSTYNVTSSDSASTLRTNLISLATKLDTDILYADDNTTANNAPLTITAGDGTAVATTVRISFAASTPSNYFVVGQNITVAGFGLGSTSSTNINGNRIITAVDDTSDYIEFVVAGVVDLDTFTVAGATIRSNVYANITQPTAPSLTPTNAELVAIQSYMESIILRLQDEPIGVINNTLITTFIDPLDVTTTSDIALDITIPQEVTSDDFVQVYRSAITEATGTTVLADLVPNDEMQLVYEAFPTSAELSARSMTVIDVTPDAFRGANLYTNEATGEGALQANDLPPFAKDINKFKNVVFYANTKTKHRKLLSLLGVSNMITDYGLGTTPKLMVTNGSTTQTYSFVTGQKEVTPITCTADAANNLNGKYFTINSANDVTQYYVWYKTSGASASDPAVAGKTGIRVEILTGETATNVAIKTKNTINRYIMDFTATDNGAGVLTVTNTNFGPATDATNGTLNTGAYNFTIGSITQGRGENASSKQVLLSNSASPSIAVDETAKSLIRVINKNASDTIYGFYLSGALSVPGEMLFESRSLNDTEFYLLGNNENTGESFNPDLSPSTPTITAFSVANPTVVTTSASHGLANGDSVVIINSTSTPSTDGVYAITYVSPTTFSIPVNVTVTGTARFIKASIAEYSDNEDKPNRIYYSKLQQPEAVPTLNYLDVGEEGKKILRILPLRDSLFVFKEDGTYRISGETAPFVLSLFDGTTSLKAPDSAVPLNNAIYCWTDNGIQSVSEAGIDLISRPIDTEVLKRSSSAYPNFSTATWAIGYEADNAYMVWTVSNTSDTIGTICFRYNVLNGSWTTFDKTNTCGMMSPVDEKLYLGAGDTNYMEQERKTFSRLDYADRELSSSLSTNQYFGTTLKLSSVTGFEAGDVLVQDQTVSPYEFNMLLKKLDSDDGVNDVNYFSTLEIEGGDNLRTQLNTLAAKLDADSGVTLTTYASSISSKSGSITSISVASPTVITCAGHGLVSGRMITISGSNSVPSANGNYQVTVLDANTFTIPLAVTTTGTTGSFITMDTNFQDIKACYNKIVDLLNSDVTVSFSNYRQNTQNTIQEAVILSVNKNTKEITLNLELPYIQGDLIVYKAIESTFTYSKNTLGDPLSWKHIRESTVMFENKAFTSATLSFATDLLPAFVDVDFNGDGNGIFGHQTFGSGFFGGASNGAPFRTYIPRNCQRCRYIVVKFTHRIARENYLILGTTLTGETGISTRAYR